MRHVTSRLLAATLVLAIGCPAAATASTPRAEAQAQGGCVRWDIWGRCVKTVEVLVATPVASPDGGDDDPAPSTAPPRPSCGWSAVSTSSDYEDVVGSAPPAMVNPVVQVYRCDEGALPGGVVGSPVGFRWADAGEPVEAGPPPPEVLAAVVHARVEALMVTPAIAADPPQASSAIVHLPVFVEVTNWQGELVDDECVPGLCVTMTATPRLTFDPGEPGAQPIVCDPPGTRFDPEGPAAAVQAAAPGACAWAYRSRSGIAGRPAAWPGEVTVDWTVSWSADDGSEGTFPGLSFATAVPRVVDEVQTVVADGGE